jgi:hypothetical protein
MLHTVGQIHFFALVKFCWANTFFCVFFSFLVLLVDLYYFISVSAVPVGALDHVAGLLNRIWWQG